MTTEIDLYLKFKCQKGLKKRGLDHLPQYQERLDFELEVIINMNFSGYFLIVSDFMTWALNNNILVGPGRGSAGGSLVAYCLYITHIDPIKGNLLFERFLNPDRLGSPDISTSKITFEKFESEILPTLDKDLYIDYI